MCVSCVGTDVGTDYVKGFYQTSTNDSVSSVNSESKQAREPVFCEERTKEDEM
jgi:hypothetical protein